MDIMDPLGFWRLKNHPLGGGWATHPKNTRQIGSIRQSKGEHQQHLKLKPS